MALIKAKKSTANTERSNSVLSAASEKKKARVNFITDEDLRAEFKLAAMKNGKEMTAVLTDFMREYVDNNR